VQLVQLVQPAPANSKEQRQGFTPATNHIQNNPPTPIPPTSLIRPVGAWTTQTPPSSPNPAQSDQAKSPKLNGASPLQPVPTPVSALKSVPPSDISLFRTDTQAQKPKTLKQFMPHTPLRVAPGQLPIPNQAQSIEHAMQQQGRGSPWTNVPIEQLPVEAAKGRPPLIEEHEQFAQNDDSFESYVATSAAAEHWRTSWRNRQRSEAGPAATASRGQSLVAEPLMAMQNTLVQMRAILLPKRPHANLRFWPSLLLMVCIIGGLSAFIASTFQTVPDSASQGIQQSVTQPPNLSISGTPTATIAQGQSLHLHGDNFAAGAPISFLLDGTVVIKDADGRELSVLASDRGSFDITILVTSIWEAGPHMLQAHDSKLNQNAYLNINIGLTSPAVTTSKELALSAKQLTFQAVMGQGNPKEQFVTLTNNSGAPLLWTARAIDDNNLSWLNIDESTNSGHLIINGITSVGINVIVDALTASTRPYTGEIIFTINASEQLTLPVVLQLSNGTPEISLNPNPVIGILSPTGGSCQANMTLQVVNLSNQQVSWSISLNSVSSTHIAFLQRGQPKVHGMLAPTGQQGDSTVLTLQCVHVKNGDVYHFAFNTNTVTWPGVVTIQTAQ
jgi:hypothetical protein